MASDFPVVRCPVRFQPAQPLAVTLRTRPPFDENALSHVRRVMLTFLGGGLGGYATSHVLPVSSTLVLTRDWRLAAPASWECYLDANQITPVCFQILRNLMAKLLEVNISIKELVIRHLEGEHEPDLMPLPNDDTEEDCYPTMGRCPFPVVFDEPPASKMRRMHVELVDSVEEAEIQAIQAVAAPWFTLVNDGGFAMPLGHPLDVLSSVGTVQIFDDNTIEIVADRFVASEMAWNVLINMLVARQGKGYRLAGITVY